MYHQHVPQDDGGYAVGAHHLPEGLGHVPALRHRRTQHALREPVALAPVPLAKVAAKVPQGVGHLLVVYLVVPVVICGRGS